MLNKVQVGAGEDAGEGAGPGQCHPGSGAGFWPSPGRDSGGSPPASWPYPPPSQCPFGPSSPRRAADWPSGGEEGSEGKG